MKRILAIETPKYLGKKVKISGWVNSRRDHGGIVFLDLRDRSGILQIVSTPDLAEGIKEEYVLEIEGEIKKRPIKMVNPELETGEFELKAEKIKILAKAESLPFDLKDLKFVEGFKEWIKYFFKFKGKTVFKIVTFYLVETKEKEVKKEKPLSLRELSKK